MKNKERYDFNKCFISYNPVKERFEVIYGNIIFALSAKPKEAEIESILRWLEME